MSTKPIAIPEKQATRELPNRAGVGMYCLIAAEAVIFTIFVVAYLFYIGKSVSGPAPKDVLQVPIFFTICLLSSSLTIHAAVKSLRRGAVAIFVLSWAFTLWLGATFLVGTAREWYRLVYREGLTVSTNLFGTTYYSLVGLHAIHVTVGLLAMVAVLLFTLSGYVRKEHAERIDVFSLYWHFVDAVWVVVFTVVYLIGR